jgi:hypothetical protein
MIAIPRTRNSILLYSKLKLLTTTSVSTWSPLATAFNTRPGRKLNLSLITDDDVSNFFCSVSVNAYSAMSSYLLVLMLQGLFGVPELRNHEGFYAIRERAVWETEKLISESCNPSRLSYFTCNLRLYISVHAVPCMHKIYEARFLTGPARW